MAGGRIAERGSKGVPKVTRDRSHTCTARCALEGTGPHNRSARAAPPRSVSTPVMLALYGRSRAVVPSPRLASSRFAPRASSGVGRGHGETLRHAASQQSAQPEGGRCWARGI